MGIKPNLFIAGAPKSGTTALYSYLKTHPSINMSSIKEPCYFADDFPNFRMVSSLQSYLQLFPEEKSCTYAGEASVWYLFSDRAIGNIYRFNPEARIVVMLRNPVDFVQSLHQQLRFSFLEDVEDFWQAWEMQAQRRKGYAIPSNCLEPRVLQYKQAACFSTQLERVYAHFPADRVLVLLYDDMSQDVSKVYDRVLSFLGLPNDGRTDFPQINAGQVWKNSSFQWVLRPSPALRRLARIYKKFSGAERIPFKYELERWIMQRYSRNEKRTELDEGRRAALTHDFIDEIRRLETMLKRDLSQWKH